MEPNFSRKNLSKIRYIFENFLKKSMFYASKRFQMERFCKILMKSPMTLHAARFKKISKNLEKFLVFGPQNPPKFTFYCIFKKEILPKNTPLVFLVLQKKALPVI